MSTILKALRRLEEDDAKSRDASTSGEERLVSDSADSNPNPKLPDSAYAAADALANSASPRAEIPAESKQDGITFDRALSLARSRAVLAVATAVGLLALTFGAISLRESGGLQLNSDVIPDAASSAAVRQAPSAPASPSSLRPTSPAAPAPAVAVPAAEASSRAVAVAQSGANPVAGSTPSAASPPAPPEPTRSSTLAASVPSAFSAPANADATPMRSRPAAPKIAKPLRSAPKPARTTSVPLAAAAVSPTRAAAAGAVATADEKIAQATQSLADRRDSRRPRAERLATPAPVSSADTDESIPLAEMLPMASETQSTSTPSTRETPQRTARATIPNAAPERFDSTAGAADRLTPLAQARAMESAAAAASTTTPRRAPIDSAAVPATVIADAVADRAEPVTAQRDRDVERVDRRGLPDVRVLRTSWHPQPDRRSVKVSVDASSEVLTLREGDAVGGLVVQTISPSSVLFEAGGIEIRRRVGGGR